MTAAALAIGAFIAALGALGVVAPESFVQAIAVFQTPPAIYVAALVRVASGVVLIRAARASRMPKALWIVGALIAAGGLATPFAGAEGERVIMGWFAAAGPWLMRAWGFAAVLLGGFIVFAARPRRSRA
ncbi:MAG TPA: hypothetical protein VMN82_15465 [Thermoanaerobaculia bacterium]|nr:hypothetical protein [Thermoanaerobaculia bacterium]